MDGYAYNKTATPVEVRSLLSDPPASLDYILQESASDIAFTHFSTPESDWFPWDRGRAFGEQIEVRWQKLQENQFQLLILTEVQQDSLTQNGWPEPRKMEVEDGGKVYLWGRHRSFLEGSKGTRAPHEWVQASIPRTLCYPLASGKEFAYIETVTYRQNGIIILTRFRRLAGENQEEVGR
jgi:hypothetical protein